jgi:hypothetical protein
MRTLVTLAHRYQRSYQRERRRAHHMEDLVSAYLAAITQLRESGSPIPESLLIARTRARSIAEWQRQKERKARERLHFAVALLRHQREAYGLRASRRRKAERFDESPYLTLIPRSA